MGKKSKRRGGTGGGKKSRQTASAGDVGGSPRLEGDQLAVAVAGLTVTPADALALLETVRPLPSLKGIISTNDDPGKCARCLSPTVLIDGVPGVRFSAYCLPCCGKRLCSACEDADCGFALDLLGEPRCTFCNALKPSIVSLCLQKATAGMAWAQFAMGFYYFAGDSPNQAFDCMVKAASQGHPEAFLRLSTLCLGKWGHPRDLMAAKVFAKKTRSLHLNLRLISNMLLVDIAKQYFEDGAVEEASAILTDVAKEADPNALDGELCDAIASLAYRIDDKQFSGEMRARAFCLGEVQSAYCASECYFVVEHYALSKLWLSVTCICKTSSGFRYFMRMDDDETVTPVPWSSFKLKQRRDLIRSKLREISDSCGGCGAALEGDTRKYCRGCKAFCYCSRECQKLHWNRADADGGHRTECKEAQHQARKILEAIQSGKIDLSKKNDDE